MNISKFTGMSTDDIIDEVAEYMPRGKQADFDAIGKMIANAVRYSDRKSEWGSRMVDVIANIQSMTAKDFTNWYFQK